MVTINHIVRDMRELWRRGQLQNIIALAYGVEGVSAGMYGRYDADVADHLWLRIRQIEKADERIMERGAPIDFREVPPAEYRAIRARAKRQRPHRDGVVSELSARGLRRRLVGAAGIVRVDGRWGYFGVGDTPEVPQLLRGVAETLEQIRRTGHGRRRSLVWLRPRSPAGERFVPRVATLHEFFAAEPERAGLADEESEADDHAE